MAQIFLCAAFTTLLLVLHRDGTYIPLCILQNSATCIPRQWRGFSRALRTSPTVIHEHFCFARAQFKLLLTLVRSLDAQSSFVNGYHFLVIPETSFLSLVVDWCYFTCCLYLGVTICHFLSYLWIHTCFVVVFALLGFSVPTSFLDLDGCFCYLFELRLIVYVDIKIISNFWTPCVSLFQTFGICVSPHIPYNTYITHGSLASIES